MLANICVRASLLVMAQVVQGTFVTMKRKQNTCHFWCASVAHWTLRVSDMFLGNVVLECLDVLRNGLNIASPF